MTAPRGTLRNPFDVGELICFWRRGRVLGIVEEKRMVDDGRRRTMHYKVRHEDGLSWFHSCALRSETWVER